MVQKYITITQLQRYLHTCLETHTHTPDCFQPSLNSVSSFFSVWDHIIVLLNYNVCCVNPRYNHHSIKQKDRIVYNTPLTKQIIIIIIKNTKKCKTLNVKEKMCYTQKTV